MPCIAIIGSKSCVDKDKKVKDLIFNIKKTFGDSVTILSGGNEAGIEQVVKKASLEFEVKYKEYNPAFMGKNDYSAMYDSYYKKGFHPSHYLHRYTSMFKNIDRLIIGQCDDAPDFDLKLYNNIKIAAEKKGIPTFII